MHPLVQNNSVLNELFLKSIACDSWKSLGNRSEVGGIHADLIYLSFVKV